MVICSYAGYQKWQHERWVEKYESREIQIAALGKAAEEKAKETKVNQDKATKEVRNESKTNRSRISAYYGSGLRLPKPGSGGLSAPADSTERANAGPSEPAPGQPSIESCALDAEQVMAFQEWVRKQRLPVE